MEGERTANAGLFGRYYALGHSKRTYRSCGGSGVYTIPENFLESNTFDELLKYALAKTITRHPILCYGMIDKTEKSEAHFLQLKTISWEDLVEIKTSELEVQSDAYLSEEIGKGHELLFEDQSRKPAWRVIILKYEHEPQRVDILFYSHHAISDGTSCTSFHKSLFGYLQEGSSQNKTDQPAWPYVVPQEIPGPSHLEEIYPFPSKTPQASPLPPSTTDDTPFDPWTAAPPSFDPFKSLARILTIPSTNVLQILTYCRQRKITLTGLLHSLITIYLANAVPSARGFRATTPFSMRRFTATSSDEIVNHVSSVQHEWTETLLSAIRKSEEGSAEEEVIIRDISGQFQKTVADELLAIPERGSKGLAGISNISDLEKYLEEAFKKGKRNVTYEISNVGLVKLAVRSEESLVKLERLTFTQCGMVMGASFGCSCASIAGGPLCVCISWQEGILEEGLAEGLATYLERRLLAFA